MTLRSVVVVNDFCHVQGGASRVAIDEALALQRLGLEVTFLGAVGPVAPELSEARIRTICLHQPELLAAASHPGALLQALWNRLAYQAAQALLAALDPRWTIVHLHGYTKALTTTPVVAARRAGFAVACTLHDFFAACPNGAFFDYRRGTPCSLRGLSFACIGTNCDKRHAAHKAYRIARGAVQRHIAGFPASVCDYIALSARSAELLRPYLPPRARFHTLPDIIDIACAPPVDVAANRTFVVVGRLEAEKGVEIAAAAARRAALPIVFVGDGPLRPAIEATGARVTGWLDADAVRNELERARCLVFPSLWYETYGLVVTEAAARGVPAIVSDISAPADRISHGENGWVFQSGDMEALVHCMRLAWNQASAGTAGAAAYRAYWENPSDPSHHAQSLAAIYASVLARAAAP